MGADASFPLTAVKPGFSMMSMTFRDGDRITVLHLDSAGISAVGQAIKDTWKPGIHVEQSRCGTGWSFKLNGYPFTSSNIKTSQQSRQMVMQILQNLHGIGYQIVASGTLGSQKDRSTLFFKKSPSNVVTPPFLCVGFSDSDKIQFTNLPSQLMDPIKDTIRTSWTMGIQRVDEENGVLQFKLAGTPWSWTANNNQESIMSKMLLQAIFTTLHRYQWVYHVNVNLNRDQDCLIFGHDPEVNTYEIPQFCMMSFGQGDRLRLINASDDVISMIRKIIEANWSPGRIQDEREFHGSYEFKISGHPWNSVREESARARYLMLKIFQEMLQHSWHNVAGFYLNRVSSDRVVLVFQKRQPVNYPMFCIAPHDEDKFWLINMPTELVSLFKHILLSRWSNGMQSENELPLHFGTVYKLKLSGTPWSGGERNSPIHARSFLCGIIEEFSKLGWQLMLCADVTSRIVVDPDYPLDVYSFWFVNNTISAKPQPSAPVYEFPAHSQQYGVRMVTSPYPLSRHIQGSDYGMAGAPPPVFNEPPPTYSQATGWNLNDAKE